MDKPWAAIVTSTATATVGLNDGKNIKGTVNVPDGYQAVGVIDVESNHALVSSIGMFAVWGNTWQVSVTQRQGSAAQSYTITARVLCIKI